MYRYILFCFFQAEDGIRDGTVTGVQTCALPILDRGAARAPAQARPAAARDRAAPRYRSADASRTRQFDRCLSARVPLGCRRTAPRGLAAAARRAPAGVDPRRRGEYRRERVNAGTGRLPPDAGPPRGTRPVPALTRSRRYSPRRRGKTPAGARRAAA